MPPTNQSEPSLSIARPFKIHKIQLQTSNPFEGLPEPHHYAESNTSGIHHNIVQEDPIHAQDQQQQSETNEDSEDDPFIYY